MREADDLRGAGASAADARVRDPFLRRDDAFGDEDRFASCPRRVQIFDGEMVGEHGFLVGAVQPMRPLALGAVPEMAEARLGEDGMACAKGDELARGQSPVTRERFEMSRMSASVIWICLLGTRRDRCERRFFSVRAP